MDDEEDDFGTGDGQGSLLEALGATAGSTQEGHDYSKKFLDQYLASHAAGAEDPEKAIIAKMKAAAEQNRRAIQAARERIKVQRYNPGELLLAASQALGAPTRTGTIGETASNVFGALREPLARRGEFERQRDDKQLELDTAEAGVDNPVNAAELQLGLVDRRLQAGLAGKALDSLSKPVRSGSAGAQQRMLKIADAYGQLVRKGYESQAAWDRATNLVDNHRRIVMDPSTGNLKIVDDIENSWSELPPAGSPGVPATLPSPGGAPAVLPSPGGAPGAPGSSPIAGTSPLADVRDQLGPGENSLWSAADRGTGWWSGLISGANIITGNIPGMGISEPTEDARQDLRNGSQPMIRALAMNDKFPVAEIERIRDEISTLPSLADNPARMKRRMVRLDKSLRAGYARAMADAQDLNAPLDLRKARESLAIAIRSFIPVLGVPAYMAVEDSQALFVEPEELEGFDLLSPEDQADLKRLREKILEGAK